VVSGRGHGGGRIGRTVAADGCREMLVVRGDWVVVGRSGGGPAAGIQKMVKI